MRTSCSAGGLVVKDDCVLLVKITYGANKGHWMLPGGLVEEEALLDTKVIGLTKEILRLFGAASNRAGLFLLENSIQTNNQWSNYDVFSLVSD